jgi:hypothetical protein
MTLALSDFSQALSQGAAHAWVFIPTAILLGAHSERTFTLESPSEFALPERAAAHRAVIEATLAAVRALGMPS